MTRLVGTMTLLACVSAAWAVGPPDMAAWARFEKIEETFRLEQRGVTLYQAGEVAGATKVMAEVLTIREGLYPKSRYPQGHPALTRSMTGLAFLYDSRGDDIRAGALYARALAMREALYPADRYPRGHPDLARSLSNMGLFYKEQGDYGRAIPLLSRAVRMDDALYPKDGFPQGHPSLAISLNNLGMTHLARGDLAGAEPPLRRALEMRETLYPRTLFPDGHAEVAGGMNNLALLHQEQGDFAKAAALYARALAMNEELYPRERFRQGHPDLARSLANSASLLQDQGNYAKSRALYTRALKMAETLYPLDRIAHGHPELVNILSGLALLCRQQGDHVLAEELYGRLLKMAEGRYPEKLFPQGHPELVGLLNGLGLLYHGQGEYAKAERWYSRALKMTEALYTRDRFPLVHADLASTLNNLAFLHHSRREFAKAEPLLRRAIRMFCDAASGLAASAPEATALNYLASQPLARDVYLTATLHLPEVDAYPAVWQTKAALSRVAQRRHLAVLAVSSKEARGMWDAVLSLKRERERLLLAAIEKAADKAKIEARDKRLDDIEKGIREKEAELRPLLPAMKRFDDLAKRTPADLRKALPADVAFIDLLRYTRFEQNPEVKGAKGVKRMAHYVAFVVTRTAITRVELGEAKPIEDALDLWRRAVVESSPSEPKYAAETHRLLWSPLVEHLPKKTSAVFVSPDAALNRLPWGALRDAKTQRILIEEYAVATIPHGPMLLDRLTEEKRKAETKPTLLAMGGVAYDKKPGASSEFAMRSPVGDAVVWGKLEGTAKELRQIVALKGERKVIRREGDSAHASALLEALPLAETAHLATHGFFADPKFRTVFQLDPKLFDRPGGERSTAGTRSPMVLSGLVCAGANIEGTPNRGVVTADAIVGLDLRKMNLAVLSACETGLGDVAGGEGVYGLVRAFHVAGTRNVVASLWKVDDEATAALMVLFYRNLWGKEKMTPMEAMRRAQLSVYRDPGKIKEWSQGRGPNLKVVIDTGKAPVIAKGATTSPAKAWAAFVLSGPGD